MVIVFGLFSSIYIFLLAKISSDTAEEHLGVINVPKSKCELIYASLWVLASSLTGGAVTRGWGKVRLHAVSVSG